MANLLDPLTAGERESMINDLIWTFELEGIGVTREEAEAALEKALSKPLLEI